MMIAPRISPEKKDMTPDMIRTRTSGSARSSRKATIGDTPRLTASSFGPYSSRRASTSQPVRPRELVRKQSRSSDRFRLRIELPSQIGRCSLGSDGCSPLSGVLPGALSEVPPGVSSGILSRVLPRKSMDMPKLLLDQMSASISSALLALGICQPVDDAFLHPLAS